MTSSRARILSIGLLVAVLLAVAAPAAAQAPQQMQIDINGVGKVSAPLQVLLRHEFGNFVCQRAVVESNDLQRSQLLELIRQYVPKLRRFPNGKRILARLDKITCRTVLPTSNMRRGQ